jgi:hypothetical protein
MFPAPERPTAEAGAIGAGAEDSADGEDASADGWEAVAIGVVFLPSSAAEASRLPDAPTDEPAELLPVSPSLPSAVRGEVSLRLAPGCDHAEEVCSVGAPESPAGGRVCEEAVEAKEIAGRPVACAVGSAASFVSPPKDGEEDAIDDGETTDCASAPVGRADETELRRPVSVWERRESSADAEEKSALPAEPARAAEDAAASAL